MSTDLIYSDATKLAELIRTREVSPVEVMKAHLDRIEAVNPKVNAVVTISNDALQSAQKAEAAETSWDLCTVCHSQRRIRSTLQWC
jgi:aspartyl-tRNA(Asn)/glutamyl-tRNA(Gln) amidotransferase subunit A